MLYILDHRLIEKICCGNTECIDIYRGILDDLGREIYIAANTSTYTHHATSSSRCLNMYFSKGYSSHIYKVVIENELYVLKVRRHDSKRETLYIEGKILEILNSWDHSPRVYRYSHNYILMEFVRGMLFREIVGFFRSRDHVYKIMPYLESLIIALCELDSMNIDHKEIGFPYKHVIYRDNDPRKPVIVDFESASISTNTSNLSRFIGGTIIRHLSSVIDLDNNSLINYMRNYKNADQTARKRICLDLIDYLGSNISL